MGTITSLTTQAKNPNRVNVFIDDEFACGLALEVALELRVGQVITRQFVFEGDMLRLNADMSGGFVRVEVLDPNFQPYPGFAAEECDPIHAPISQVWHTVSWQGQNDLRMLWNKPVRLLFHLHQASLYAFEFAATGRSYGRF